MEKLTYRWLANSIENRRKTKYHCVRDIQRFGRCCWIVLLSRSNSAIVSTIGFAFIVTYALTYVQLKFSHHNTVFYQIGRKSNCVLSRANEKRASSRETKTFVNASTILFDYLSPSFIIPKIFGKSSDLFSAEEKVSRTIWYLC